MRIVILLWIFLLIELGRQSSVLNVRGRRENKMTELFKIKNYLKLIPQMFKNSCSGKILLRFPATLIF